MTSADNEKNWLDRVVESAQKEVDTWSDYKRQVYQREAEKTYYPEGDHHRRLNKYRTK